MGDFRIRFEAVGGHGCERRAKEGEEVHGCGSQGCPDCLFAEFVAKMARAGVVPKKAEFTHWPDTPSAVVDDYALYFGSGNGGWTESLRAMALPRAPAIRATGSFSE